MKTEPAIDQTAFLQGGGEMGELMRIHNWQNSSLGEPGTWPLSLRTTVGLILHSSFPMFLFWGKDLLCFYNDAYRPSLGVDGKHPALGKKGKEVWPEIWEFIGPLIEKVTGQGESFFFEDRLVPIYRNGKVEEVYWTFSYSPAFDDEGAIAGALVTCTETTEKVRALAVLQENKNLMEFAIEATELGTWELNPSTRKFKGNKRLKEWFGLMPEEEIDLSLAMSVIAEKDRDKVHKAIVLALDPASGGHYDVEYTIRNPLTGKDKIVKAKGKAYFNDQQLPYTFSGTLQDVTDEANVKKQLAIEVIEQKRIREKVEESEAHLQLLRDTVPAMIFYLDEQQRYKSYNGVFAEWFNVNATEALGKSTREFLGEAAYAIAAPYLAKAYTGEQTRYEMHAPQRMSGGKWLSIVYTPHRNSEGTVIGVIVHATDISQSKQSELSLRNSEQRFRSLIEEAPVATCLFTGRELIVEIANELMLRAWGKDRSVIGMPLADAVPELRGQPYLQILDDIFTTGKAHSESAALARLEVDGVLGDYYYNYTYKPLLNDGGEVYGIMNMAIDVTTQVETQKRIEESELFARDVIANSPVAKIVYTGPEMRISIVNENMLQLLGRDNTISGQTFVEAIPELKGSILEERMKKVFETGETFSQAEDKIDLMKFGKLYTGYYNYIYKALRNVSGEIYGIMATATEVTQQVVTRQIIEAKEQELRELINSAPIGICVLTAPDAKFQEVNERFVMISGKKRELFEGATYWEVFPEVADTFAPILEAVFKTGTKYTSEETEMVLVRSGVPEKIFATFDYVPILDIHNTVAKVIVLVIEVTHQVETRKKIEAAVEERTRELGESNLNLKRSNAELEQFAYIASHDLQEPIRKISTFLQLLERRIPDPDEKAKDFIAKIYKSTDRMTQLIRDVLAFSKITHETNLFEKVNLTKIISAIQLDFDLQIEESKAAIHLSNLPVIEAMPSQMTQLFGNLMSNSLKYIRPGVSPVINITGSIAKKDKIALYPSLDPSKKYYHIEFSDNGIGFKQEHAERIFRIFQRLHGKNEFEGTGIGLSICQKIVQNHFGNISAAAGTNGGAVFNILLPEAQVHTGISRQQKPEKIKS